MVERVLLRGDADREEDQVGEECSLTLLSVPNPVDGPMTRVRVPPTHGWTLPYPDQDECLPPHRVHRIHRFRRGLQVHPVVRPPPALRPCHNTTPPTTPSARTTPGVNAGDRLHRHVPVGRPETRLTRTLEPRGPATTLV